MRHSVPLGWSARRKPHGDSFVSCLLTCIVVIGGLVWGYFHFFENRHLDNWDTGHNFAAKDPGSESMNHYRKKMMTSPKRVKKSSESSATP